MTDPKPPAVNEVSLDLRYLDEKSAKKKDGGQWKIVKEKLNAAHHVKSWWNTFFIISCFYAVFNDPIFCYINAIDFENKCMTTHPMLAALYFCCRLATDVVYLLDIIIYKCGCCEKGKTTSCRERIKNLFSSLSRIFLSLPVAEIFVAEFLFGSSFGLFFILLTAIQYILRIYYFYDSLKCRSIIVLTLLEKWVKPILDFVPFILTSYLAGAFWHLFATRKQVACWVLKRHDVLPAIENVTIYVSRSVRSFRCKTGVPANTTYNHNFAYFTNVTNGNVTRTYIVPNISVWENSCPLDQPDPSKYDFGIYFYALQSQVTSSRRCLSQRVFQSLWWALRNLSSFGSNLNSSMDWLEIAFCVSISIGGMALFLVYLNARVEESQERSRIALLKEKKKIMSPDIDLWLSKQNLLKDTEETKKNQILMKTVIMDNLHKLEENNDVNLDLKNILTVLPIKDKKRIMCSLFNAFLIKVPVLRNINEKVLKAICEHLVPVTYTEESCIVKEGKPLGKFLLITQGVAVTYSNVGTSGSSTSNEWLNKGDFYGEKLLEWAFDPSFPDLPISSKNVIAQEKVEAFVVRANDLKSVFVNFWWLFTKGKDISKLELERWEHLATSSIRTICRERRAQTHSKASYKKPTWLHLHAETTGPIRWDRFKLS